jgi:hypothetical protein
MSNDFWTAGIAGSIPANGACLYCTHFDRNGCARSDRIWRVCDRKSRARGSLVACRGGWGYLHPCAMGTVHGADSNSLLFQEQGVVLPWLHNCFNRQFPSAIRCRCNAVRSLCVFSAPRMNVPEALDTQFPIYSNAMSRSGQFDWYGRFASSMISPHPVQT